VREKEKEKGMAKGEEREGKRNDRKKPHAAFSTNQTLGASLLQTHRFAARNVKNPVGPVAFNSYMQQNQHVNNDDKAVFKSFHSKCAR